MKESGNNILIIGIGNSGRADDGLGWAFIDEIKSSLPDLIDCEYRYQLQIEDAELIGHYSQVYFVDADTNTWEGGFRISKCGSKPVHGFSTHELEPETVVYLAESLYNKNPEAYILGISGLSFNLEMGLTPGAKRNLELALKYFEENILNLIT